METIQDDCLLPTAKNRIESNSNQRDFLYYRLKKSFILTKEPTQRDTHFLSMLNKKKEVVVLHTIAKHCCV